MQLDCYMFALSHTDLKEADILIPIPEFLHVEFRLDIMQKTVQVQ